MSRIAHRPRFAIHYLQFARLAAHRQRLSTPIPTSNGRRDCMLCICSRESCRMYRASDWRTCANGCSWRAGTRIVASHSTSYNGPFCRGALPKCSAVQRNPECARISQRCLSTTSVAAAKIGCNGIGSRWEYSRWASESNGQCHKGESSLQE